jgi:hypothetical protein
VITISSVWIFLGNLSCSKAIFALFYYKLLLRLLVIELADVKYDKGDAILRAKLVSSPADQQFIPRDRLWSLDVS